MKGSGHKEVTVVSGEDMEGVVATGENIYDGGHFVVLRGVDI